MKKYNYIIVSLLACLLTTSCNDYFDQVPDDRLSLKEIFTTRDGALRYLSNVYTFLPDEFNQRQVHETSLYRTPVLGRALAMRRSGQMTKRKN